ncbi:MAG: DUF2103 domain-containing protein [Oculatellaceae cyanobacterium Prado106]|jgi:hypothetical protein|nr:DUF2103 domain-containing protein [Oculatellaceae cyanobacterium Prado106]
MGKSPGRSSDKSSGKSSGKSPEGTSRAGKGRVVWNHSTHLPGLIPILERLTEWEGIQTITPAVIGHARSNTHIMSLKVSVPIRGGFKLIARKGKTFQEVFILTTLSQQALEDAIATLINP